MWMEDATKEEFAEYSKKCFLREINDISIIDTFVEYLKNINVDIRNEMLELLIRFESIEMAEIQYRYRQGDENSIGDFIKLNGGIKYISDMKNIKTMIKFCSKLGDIFEHPYYFNWSTSTNHRDDSPDGEIRDISHAIFRFGLYVPKETIINGKVYDGRNKPIEKSIFFGQVDKILKFTPFNILLIDDISTITRDEYPIKSFEDLELHK